MEELSPITPISLYNWMTSYVYIKTRQCTPSPQQVFSSEAWLHWNAWHLPRHQTQTPAAWEWCLGMGYQTLQVCKESCHCKDYASKHLPPQYRLQELAPNPFPSKYEPGIDTYFQSLIGMMHWMVELGRIDIATEVSLLLLHLALLHEGHLDAALHITAYLGLHYNSHLCMDQTY